MLTLEQIEQQVLACRACLLVRNPVPGDGPAPADVMFVGQAPGRVEDRNRTTFSGPAGRLLREVLASLDYPVDEWYFTNIVKCFPGGGVGGDKVPPAGATETCFSLHLVQEIQVVQPKLIVAVGAFSMRVFGITGGINQNAGRVFDTPWGRVLCALHPAGIMRRPSSMGEFRTQFHRIRTELVEPVVVPLFEPVEPEMLMGFDIETQDTRTWCIGMATNSGMYANKVGEPLSTKGLASEVPRDCLVPVTPIFHNAGFDISYLESEDT